MIPMADKTVALSEKNHKRISILKNLLDASTFEEAVEHALFALAREKLEYQNLLKLHNCYW